ncbi:MAG: hypothetical protein MRJ65_13945 [Candidatus Brocadiaceae bacterium]|nr:hypothetical protein [Candidatus Brocadiaceae bacterium]
MTKQKEAEAIEKERAITNAELKKLEEEKRAEVERIEAEVERIKALKEKEVAEKQKEKDKIRTETMLIEKAKEKEKLMSLAADKNIQAKYRPFLMKGNTYLLSSGGKFRLNKNTLPVPMSYSRLVKYGALNGLNSFVKTACSRSNDRPPWPKPNTDEDWKEYEKLLTVWNISKLIFPLLGKL